MEYISIVPPQWEGDFPYGSYRMALAHWVLEYPAYPRDIQKNAGYIILDNSAFEDAQPSYQELCKALDMLQPQEFILPNVRGNPTETIQRSLDFVAFLYTRGYVRSVMFVPTGHTLVEWNKCLDDWLYEWDICKLSTDRDLIIGISALKKPGTTDPIIGSKALLLEECAVRELATHLLGIPDPREFYDRERHVCKDVGTRTVDTSLAFALGAAGEVLTPSAGKFPLMEPDAYCKISRSQRQLILRNINVLRSWVE